MNDPSYGKTMGSLLTLSELRQDLATAILAMGDLIHLIGRSEPPRVSRRPFVLSHAAMATSST